MEITLLLGLIVGVQLFAIFILGFVLLSRKNEDSGEDKKGACEDFLSEYKRKEYPENEARNILKLKRQKPKK